MATSIYVGNLTPTTAADDLRAAFEQYGRVTRAQIIFDPQTGRSHGFGNVEMVDEAQAQATIVALANTPLNGQLLVVDRADAVSPKDNAALEGTLTAEEIQEIEQSGITLAFVIREIETMQE